MGRNQAAVDPGVVVSGRSGRNHGKRQSSNAVDRVLQAIDLGGREGVNVIFKEGEKRGWTKMNLSS